MTKNPSTTLVVPSRLTPLKAPGGNLPTAIAAVDVLKLIPEEQVWLDGLKTKNTERAYRKDVSHFAWVLGIESSQQLYAADHRAVTYWEKYMREVEGLEPSSIRRRLSALSSLFKHLVEHTDQVQLNPVREIKRPELDRSEGKTLAFSKKEARKLLDAPDAQTLIGKRDRAILSVGFQAGFRREEIASLQVDALHKNRGLDALWIRRKRKRNRQSVKGRPTGRVRTVETDKLVDRRERLVSRGPLNDSPARSFPGIRRLKLEVDFAPQKTFQIQHSRVIAEDLAYLAATESHFAIS